MLICPLEYPHFPEDIGIVLSVLAVMIALCLFSDSHAIPEGILPVLSVS